MGRVFLSLFLLLSISLFSQETVLRQNINVDAKELIHNLNKTNDSLVLYSNFTIFKVEIFNSKYNKIINVGRNLVSIPLYNIPLGRHTVAVFVNRKIIALNLLRNKPYKKEVKQKIPENKVLKGTNITEYDTIKVVDTINIFRTVVFEEIINIKYDTIGYITKKYKRDTIRSIPYDLSTKNNDNKIIKQTRKDYRKRNLKPNGKPYKNE